MPRSPIEWLAYVATLATVLLAASCFEGTAPWWSPLVPIPCAFALVWCAVWGRALATEPARVARYHWGRVGSHPFGRRAAQLLFAFGVACCLRLCAGCTALTDFDRFHYGEGLEQDGDAGELEHDAGEDLGPDSGPKPYTSKLLGTWAVDRSPRSSTPCTYAPAPNTSWVVGGSAAALTVTVDTGDRFTGRELADGSFQLSGSMQTITGKVSSDGRTFEGLETNTQPVYGQPCTVTRGLAGAR